MTMRSPLWFVVAGVIGLAGLAGAYHLSPKIQGFDLDLDRIAGPGSQVLSLDHVGQYTLYFETSGFVDGEFVKGDVPAGLRIALASDKTGEGIKLGDPRSSFTYSARGHTGRAILGFTIKEPGRYRLTSTLPSGRTEPRFTLAVGYGSVMGRFFSVFRGMVIAGCVGLAGLGIALIIVILTIIGRGKTKQAKA